MNKGIGAGPLEEIYYHTVWNDITLLFYYFLNKNMFNESAN